MVPVNRQSAPLVIPGHDSRIPYTFNERLAQLIPKFGGTFTDEGGRLNVYLTDLNKQEEATSVLQRDVSGFEKPEKPIKFLQGKYTYIELRLIHASIPNLGKGISGFGIDSRRNRYLIQVVSPAEIEETRTILRKAGFPMDAFLIEVAERAKLLGGHTD
jgi:hypothetical protein